MPQEVGSGLGKEKPLEVQWLFLCHSRNLFPAPGAKNETRGYLLAAAQAASLRPGLEVTRLSPAYLIKNSPAQCTLHKSLSPLDRDERNEEQADIVVQAFEPCGGQSTIGTDPRLIIHCHFSGLNSADKDEGASPPDHSVHHEGR